MVTLIVLWILLIAISALAASWLFQPDMDSHAPLEGWIFALGSAWCGLLLMGWYFFALALFSSLSGAALLIFWSVAVLASTGAFLYLRMRRISTIGLFRPSISSAFLLFSLAIMLAERSTWIGNLDDTGGYHWNIVQWLNEHGVVSGLGLFQIRLGTSSSWLALTAALNAGILEERVLSVANGAIILVSISLFLIMSIRIARGSTKQSDWFLAAGLLFLVPTMLRWDMRLSPSPDVPVLVAPFIFVWYMLRAEERSRLNIGGVANTETSVLPLIFATLAVTVKLNALPLLLIALGNYILVDRRQGVISKRVLYAGIIVATGFAPLVATSFTATGCPLFPSSIGCVDVSFGIGANTAREYSALVRSTAEWGIRGLLVASAIAFVAVLAGWKRLTVASGWTIALALLGIGFVLAFAPTARFGRGYLLLLPALAIAVHRQALANSALRFARSIPRVAGGAAILLLAAIFAAPLYKDLRGSGGLRIDQSINAPNPDRFLWPTRLQYQGPFRDASMDDFRYAVAVNGTCWNHPIPCASNLESPLKQDFRLRDPRRGLGGGFVRR